MRGWIATAQAAAPSMSFSNIAGDAVFRFPLLSCFLSQVKAFAMPFAIPVEWWMAELELWLDIVFGKQDDRESRNHNPWADGGPDNIHADTGGFEQ